MRLAVGKETGHMGITTLAFQVHVIQARVVRMIRQGGGVEKLLENLKMYQSVNAKFTVDLQ
jgi:hypothetical protein